MKAKKSLSHKLAVTYMRQILDGLNYLHQQGSVNTDLRPEKVPFVSDGSLLTIGGMDCPLERNGRIVKPMSDIRSSLPYISPKLAIGSQRRFCLCALRLIGQSKSDLWTNVYSSTDAVVIQRKLLRSRPFSQFK